MSAASPTSRTAIQGGYSAPPGPRPAPPGPDRDLAFRLDTVSRLQSLEARVETLLAALERDAKPRKLAPAIDRQILAIAIEQAFTDASDAQLSRPGEFLIDRLALLGLEIVRARPLT